MSMVCNLRQASDAQIGNLLAEPEGIGFFLYGPQPIAPPPKPSFLARLFRRREPVADHQALLYPPPSSAPCNWTAPTPEEEVYLDKAWHGIHYLLTSSAWEGEEPWCYLVKGGTKIGDVDVGYGPARALRSSEVMTFDKALSSVTVEMLSKRFDPQKMMELDIYPTIWKRDLEDDDTLNYLLEYFDILKNFVRQAAHKNLGLIVWTN